MKTKLKIAHCFHTLLAVLVSLFFMSCASMAVDTPTWDKTFSKLESFFNENLGR